MALSPTLNQIALGPSGSGAFGVNPNANWNPATHSYILPNANPDETTTSPIISANQAIDHYTNAKNFADTTAQGVASQAQNNAQNQANNSQGGQTTQSQGNQLAGGQNNAQGGATDNTDLANALNNASAALQPDLLQNAQNQTNQNDQSLANDQATRDQSTQQFNDTISQITGGTFPLTPTQQSLVNQTQSAVQQMIASTQALNQATSQGQQVSNAATGLSRYAPLLALGNINGIAAAGAAKIAQIELNGAKQLSDLQTAFETADYDMIQKSYDALQASLDKKDSLLNTLNANIQKQVDAYNANQLKIQDNARTALNTILTQLGGTAFKDLPPQSQAELADLEAKAGWPPGLVEQGLNTVAQQKAQAQQEQAAQNEKDRVAQEQIANEFKQAALDISKQKLAITINNSGAGTTDNGRLPGTTGSPTIDATQPGYASQPVPGAGGLSQAAIDQAALHFALTGVMPSIGLGSTGAAGQKRNAIQNRAGELDAGGNIAANKAQLAANTQALDQQTTYLNQTQRSLTNAENGINQLISSFKSKGINNFSLPIANIIANKAKYNLGSGEVSAYNAGLQEVANEYTQVFSRGGQTSDAVRSQAQQIIDGNISIDNLQKVSDELQAQGDIVIKGAAAQINNIQKQINSITSGDTSTPWSFAGEPTTQPANTTAMIDSSGKLYYIPNDKVQDAKSAGLKYKAPSQ